MGAGHAHKLYRHGHSPVHGLPPHTKLAAVLTVIGYSVNDSVVVFDRVRETGAARRGRAFADVAGDAVLQTLPRTVNTGASTLLVLLALLVLGGWLLQRSARPGVVADGAVVIGREGSPGDRGPR